MSALPAPHWLQRVRHRAARVVRGTSRDAGFTILEALISFLVFAVVATSSSVAIYNALKASRTTQQRVDAADLAQFFISKAIREASTIPPVEGNTILTGVGDTGQAGTGHTAEGEQFNVIETVKFDAGSCNSGRLFTVNVEIRQAQTNQFLARSDARVACPRS